MKPVVKGHIQKLIVKLLLDGPKTKHALLLSLYHDENTEVSKFYISLRNLQPVLMKQGYRIVYPGKWYGLFGLVKEFDAPRKTWLDVDVTFTVFEQWIINRLKDPRGALLADLIRETESSRQSVLMIIGRIRGKIERHGWTIPKQQSRRLGARHTYRIELIRPGTCGASEGMSMVSRNGRSHYTRSDTYRQAEKGA